MFALITTRLLVLLSLAATAFVAGWGAIRRLDVEDGWVRFAVAVALGLSILAHAGLLLGWLGLLTRGAVIAMVILVHLLGIGVWREIAGEIPSSWVQGSRWRPAWIGLGFLIVLAPVFGLALYPPTAFDETSYHLPVAVAFARSGGVPFLQELRFPVFPHLANVLFTEVLLLAGDAAIHLVELLATVAVAGLLLGGGTRKSSPAVGWMAASLFLGYPIVVYLSGTGYVDAGFALFVTSGLYSAERWRETQEGGWLVLAGLFAASAAGMKYHGLFFVLAILVLVGTAAPTGRRARSVLAFALVAFAGLAPWYGRILYYTGDPLFPAGLSSASPWAMGPLGPGLRERLAALPTLPWDVIARRTRMGSQPPFSPAFLLGLPLLFTAAIHDARLRRLLAVSGIYLLVLLFAPADARYLVAVVPVLSLALAADLARLGESLLDDRWRRGPVIVVLCVLFVLPGWLYGLYRINRQGPLPVTAQERDQYLARQLPVYPGLRFLNRRHGSGYAVYAFHAERMRYFAEGRFLGDFNGPCRYARFLPLVQEPRLLYRELRGVRADHLLVVRDTGLQLPTSDPAFHQLFLRVYSDETSQVFELRPTPRETLLRALRLPPSPINPPWNEPAPAGSRPSAP